MNEIIFLTTYPAQDASTRLRIYPLIQALSELGVPYEIDILLPDWAYARKNSGLAWRAIIGGALVVSSLRRLWGIRRLDERTVVVIHREAFPFFTPLIESLIQKKAGATVVDLDDAVYRSPGHGKDWRRFLRSPERAEQYIGSADLVLAGSPFVRDAALRMGAREAVWQPTCPPRYEGSRRQAERSIAWIGSQSTLGNLSENLDEVLNFCANNDYILRVVGGANISELPQHPRIIARRWTPKEETEALRISRIGLMPLNATEWDAGKSSYKALLYMANGVFPVVSAVGMNEWLAKAGAAVTLVGAHESWSEVLETVCQLPNTEMDRRIDLNKRFVLDNADGQSNASRGARLIATLLAKCQPQ